jgi:hypothetical protein
MTRPRVILGPSGAYFVRAVTKDRRPILGSTAGMASWPAELLVATTLYFRHALAFRLYAYVVLPDAFEAVIRPPAEGAAPANISRIMMEIKGSFAHWYNVRLGRRGSVWEKRFRDRLLLSTDEIRAAEAEVHLRPLAEGLVTDAVRYPYSGLGSGSGAMRLLDRLPVREGALPGEVRAHRSTSSRRLRRAG